ncbi:MAG: PfkB family carbohydrate kinase, partial [Enterobacteriaceae bacterium]
MQKGKLVVLGSINVDHVLSVDTFPRPGETVAGHRYQTAFGGKGANQAVAAGRSGADITFIACVGSDDVGEQIRQQLSQDNIDMHLVEAVTGEKTGVAMIMVDGQGENMIAIAPGANAALTPALLQKHQHAITSASALLMQLESPLETVEQAAELAKQHGV